MSSFKLEWRDSVERLIFGGIVHSDYSKYREVSDVFCKHFSLLINHHESDFHRAKDLIAFCVANWLVENDPDDGRNCLNMLSDITKYFTSLSRDKLNGIESNSDL